MLHRSKNSPVVVLLRVDSKSLSSTLHALHLIGLAVPWLVGKVHYTILVLWVQQSQPMGSTVPLMYIGGAFWDVRLRTTKSYPQVIHSLSTIHPQGILPVYKCSTELVNKNNFKNFCTFVRFSCTRPFHLFFFVRACRPVAFHAYNALPQQCGL